VLERSSFHHQVVKAIKHARVMLCGSIGSIQGTENVVSSTTIYFQNV
jgi:hypothetical protein